MKKKLILMGALLLSAFGMNAQTVTVDASALSCNDLVVAFFAKCTDPAMYTCVGDGATISLSVTPHSVTTYNMGTAPWAIGSDPTALDPFWDYCSAAVMHTCEGTGGAHPLCHNADRCDVGGSVDIMGGGGTCPPSLPAADCLQYTATCGSCPVGTVINAAWSGSSGSYTLRIW